MGIQIKKSVEEKASLDTIEKRELKKLFHIKTDRTIDAYIKRGVFKQVGDAPKFDPFDFALFDRQHICNILGLKTLPDEPFLTTEEAIEIIGLPKEYKSGLIRAYCRRHKIPFYILENAKGTKTYFLRSELESSVEYKLKWGSEFPDLVAKNHFLTEIFKVIMRYDFSSSLKEKQKLIIEEVIFNRKTISQISKELNVSHENCRTSFYDGCKRMFYQISMLNFNLSRLSELSQENIKLQLENNILIERLSEFTKESTPIEKQNIENLSQTFNDDNLSVRTAKLLNRMEVKTLYDLSLFTRSEVEKYRNVGKKTINGLESLLKQYGLDWKKEPEIKTIKMGTWNIKKPYKRTNLGDVKTRLVEIEKKLKDKRK